MRQRRIYTFVVVALCLGGSIEASVERESADSLYQAAVEQIGRVPVKEEYQSVSSCSEGRSEVCAGAP